MGTYMTCARIATKINKPDGSGFLNFEQYKHIVSDK